MAAPTYDTDFYAWTQTQAAALRAKDLAALDLEHLAEEIADLGQAIESHREPPGPPRAAPAEISL